MDRLRKSVFSPEEQDLGQFSLDDYGVLEKAKRAGLVKVKVPVKGGKQAYRWKKPGDVKEGEQVVGAPEKKTQDKGGVDAKEGMDQVNALFPKEHKAGSLVGAMQSARAQYADDRKAGKSHEEALGEAKKAADAALKRVSGQEKKTSEEEPTPEAQKQEQSGEKPEIDETKLSRDTPMEHGYSEDDFDDTAEVVMSDLVEGYIADTGNAWTPTGDVGEMSEQSDLFHGVIDKAVRKAAKSKKEKGESWRGLYTETLDIVAKELPRKGVDIDQDALKETLQHRRGSEPGGFEDRRDSEEAKTAKENGEEPQQRGLAGQVATSLGIGPDEAKTLKLDELVSIYEPMVQSGQMQPEDAAQAVEQAVKWARGLRKAKP